MARPDVRRAAILEAVADHLLAQGLGGASLRPLAAAAGLSDRMLLYYFKDKAELLTAAFGVISARLVPLLGARAGAVPLPLAELHPRLQAIVLADDLWPYMRLWLDVAAQAARGDGFYRAIGGATGRGFLAWGAAQLDSTNPAEAARLLVMLEGAVLLKSLGLEDICAAAL